MAAALARPASHDAVAPLWPSDDQREARGRLNLPFDLLSDENLEMARALHLPTFEVDGMVLLKRMALIVRQGRIAHVFYPVFPPDRNAGDVLAWLRSQAR